MSSPEYFSIKTEAFQIEDGSWIVTSPNVPGIFLAGNDLELLVKDTPNVIRNVFKANFGMDVQVYRESLLPQKDKINERYIKVKTPESWAALRV